MALEISLRKAEGSEAEQLRAELERLRPMLVTIGLHADGDMQIFDEYMRALALPKESDADKNRRKLALQEAIAAATKGPIAAAHTMLSALNIALAAARMVQVQVLSDVAAGADLLRGSIGATLRNVDINLPQVKNAEMKERFLQERREVARAAEEEYLRIETVVTSRLQTGS
jgi:formiminotetrahydrofolate cyclodeaminase